MHRISEKRNLREHHAINSLGWPFWVAALGGLLFISVGFYPFPPKRNNLILLSAYAAYTGFILFTIYAMSNPYGGAAALAPLLFEQLITEVGG